MKISEMSIEEIRACLAALHMEQDDILSICMDLSGDRRTSVQRMGERLKRREALWQKEQKRMMAMHSYEDGLREAGLKNIAGMDEVGRGPLAGPVVSAVVILPPNLMLAGLNDSKKLSEKQRNLLYCKIMSHAVAVAVGMASPREIDRLNILNATKLSMERAVRSLNFPIDHLLIDALVLDGLKVALTAIIKGDEKSASIAAASIVAKVARDNMMKEMSRYYGAYGFDRNKGYGTSEHIEALRKWGPTDIHRKSFIKGILGGESHQ